MSRSWRRRSRGCRRANVSYFLIYYDGAWEVFVALSLSLFVVIRVACVFCVVVLLCCCTGCRLRCVIVGQIGHIT